MYLLNHREFSVALVLARRRLRWLDDCSGAGSVEVVAAEEEPACVVVCKSIYPPPFDFLEFRCLGPRGGGGYAGP